MIKDVPLKHLQQQFTLDFGENDTVILFFFKNLFYFCCEIQNVKEK